MQKRASIFYFDQKNFRQGKKNCRKAKEKLFTITFFFLMRNFFFDFKFFSYLKKISEQKKISQAKNFYLLKKLSSSINLLV